MESFSKKFLLKHAILQTPKETLPNVNLTETWMNLRNEMQTQ